MSILKKITSFLFEETQSDVIAEDELEDVSFHKKTQPKEELKEPAIEEYTASQPLVSKQEAVQRDETKKFVSIELEEPKEKTVKKEAAVKTGGMPILSKEERKEYEFTPVISPMFGAKEEEKQKVKQAAKQPVEKKKKAKKKKQNPLGTIISPYYGAGELEELEEEAQKDIELREKEKSEDICEVLKAEESNADSAEDIKNVSLEELIADEERTESSEEDLLQISLFGEAKPLKDTEAEQKAKE